VKREYQEELLHLTPRQYNIVLGGLIDKLGHYERTNKLSYAYEVCPVCADIGSTLDNPGCGRCYIEMSCQAPFNDGFRDDQEEGVAYFTEMLRFLENNIPPKVLIVGGTWDKRGGRKSSVVDILAEEMDAFTMNGGHVRDLPTDIPAEFDLIIWMPNVSNEETRWYPQKKTGQVLVISKVMRSGYTKADSVSRIFKMHANAVIEIYMWSTRFDFALRDAMANIWRSPTSRITELAEGLMELYRWTKGSLRVRSERVDRQQNIHLFMELNHQIADRVQNSIGERYFGNISTRCQSMYPGVRAGACILISPRNTDKRHLNVEDMVAVTSSETSELEPVVNYWGPRKPSVDAPVQLTLFENYPSLNFIIHGHAHVKDAPTTPNYYPCGDLREALELLPMMGDSCGAINLRNHGFILYSETIEEMITLVDSVEFEEPN
jgi:hypothetical protein